RPGMKHPQRVIRNQGAPHMDSRLTHRRQERRTVRLYGGAATAVDAHDLLHHRVGAAGEDTALHGRGVAGLAPHPRRVRTALLEEGDEVVARLVLADPADD